MVILETGMIFVAIGIIMVAIGYNFTLAGYSRKKMLEGISMQTQMYSRRHIGNILMQAGIATTVVSTFLIFVMFGLFLTVDVIKTTPRKVDIVVTQGRTVVIADGKIYKFAKAHYRIRKLYLRQKINPYGFECLGTHNELIIEVQQDQWEALDR